MLSDVPSALPDTPTATPTIYSECATPFEQDEAYIIQVQKSGLILHTSPTDSTVIQSDSTDAETGNWLLQPTENNYYYIVNEASGLYIEAPSSTSFVNVVEGTGSPNQRYVC